MALVRVVLPAPPPPVADTGRLAPRLPSLGGNAVGIINNGWACMEPLVEELREILFRDHGVTDLVEVRTSGAQRLPDDKCDALADAVQAVVIGLGHCGSCSRWIMHDAIQMERRGVPTVTLFTEAFIELARALARAEGIPDVAAVTLPHPLNPLPPDEVRQITREHAGEMCSALMQERRPAGMRA